MLTPFLSAVLLTDDLHDSKKAAMRILMAAPPEARGGGVGNVVLAQFVAPEEISFSIIAIEPELGVIAGHYTTEERGWGKRLTLRKGDRFSFSVFLNQTFTLSLEHERNDR